jgi:hypothetical protein
MKLTARASRHDSRTRIARRARSHAAQRWHRLLGALRRAVAIDHVEIEGRIDPASVEPARRAWIAREMAALGL